MRGWTQVLYIEVAFKVHEVVHHWLFSLFCGLVGLLDVKPVNLEIQGDVMAPMHGVEPHRGIHEVGTAVTCYVFYTNWLVGRDTPRDIEFFSMDVAERLEPYDVLIPF